MAAAKKSSDKPKGSVAAARGGKSAGGGVHRYWEGFKSLAGTIAIFLILRTFFVEAYRIPSGSMIPTMLVGDWLFVNKLVYGPHVPFTHINLPGLWRTESRRHRRVRIAVSGGHGGNRRGSHSDTR
jgi:signal peptidase I